MKKLLTILLASIMLLTLAACHRASQQGQPDTPPAQEPDAAPAVQPTETEVPAAAGGSKILVVYYSATGSTEAVAGYIADALDGDTFAITPAEPYTSGDLDWRDADSRVSREYDDPALRTMELTATAVEDWDTYDTVFIGYPIWWGIAAWPVDNFIAANDFTGKTVIPFCTSASSGLGESGELLVEMAGTGSWLEGQRFRSSAPASEVREWALGLALPNR